jgi:hypothetical protein
MAKEGREPTPGAAVMISRILDLMYIQMLRVRATFTQSSPGWLRAGMDPGTDPGGPVLVPALAAECDPWLSGSLDTRS